MKTVRWGIIGAGNIAKRFAASLAHEPRSRLVCVSGRTPAKLEAFAQQFDVEIEPSYQAILDRPDIDAVYIALPHGLHAEWAIAALKAGKAVLCEKPAALSAAQMAAIAEVALTQNVLFMEAMKPRMVPLYGELMDRITAGALGQIGSIETSLLRTFDRATLGYFLDPAQGGAAYDMGIYGASWIAQFCAGDIQVVRHQQNIEDMIDWYDDCSMVIDGIACRLECAADRGNSCTATIKGSLAELVVYDLHRPERARITYNDGTYEDLERPYVVDDFYGQISHFVDLLEAGKTQSPLVSLDDSIKMARIIDCVRSGYDVTATAEALRQDLGQTAVLADEPLADYTTFKLGGRADLLAVPESPSYLVDALRTVREQNAPYFVLGKGSDLLVSDAGYRGVVIACGDGLSNVEVSGTTMRCQAGMPIIEASEMAAALGLSGLEFACGIPGSVGGAIFMNAGAYAGCIADVLTQIEAIMPDGTVQTIPASELELGYRTSRVKTDGLVVINATFELKAGDADKIHATMDDLNNQRAQKQPLEQPSAGSTFKRPEGYFVGKLVSDAGLRGYRVGGASVSKKHAGFVVNDQHGTAADVAAVIKHVQDVIQQEDGVVLEPEVRYLGWF